jgi:hypothetical protein
MEISSTIVERALDGVNELALSIAAASCLYLMLCRRARPVVGTPAPVSPGRCSRLVRRSVSLLGLLVTLASPAGAAQRSPLRRGPVPSRQLDALRSEPGRFPPPRLPGPAEPLREGRPLPGVEGPPRMPVRPGPRPPWSRADVSGSRSSAGHPAVHGGRRSDRPEPLFPRWRPVRAAANARARGASEARASWHAVLPGDTLWSIAAERLETDDVRRIARYWPRIHRANRDEIGPNPDLIRPGQVLELPPEHA